jgi:hypothetical protein
MFERGARFQSNAEYVRSRATASVHTAAAQWHREAETWFDGTVESVDRRLAVCDRLLHEARRSLADNLGNSRRIAQVDSLEQARVALAGLRNDILTGGEWRHDRQVAPSPQQMQRLLAALAPADRRYVELESAKLIRNASCDDPRELAGRAWRQASDEFSRFGQRRSDHVADAMAARVFHLARRSRPKRTAAARHSAIQDFPAELLYL